MGYYDEVDEVGWKGVKWFLILTFLFAVVGGIGWCAHAAFYPVEQAQRIVEHTLNADNVIYNYEWFHQHHSDWLAAGTNADAKQRELDTFLASAGPVNTWGIATQREANQLRVELSGLRAHRVNLANEYNAHVGMANRDLFRSRNLPEHLPTE
jgi:hypothetical protein